jgi:hypothetical protein
VEKAATADEEAMGEEEDERPPSLPAPPSPSHILSPAHAPEPPLPTPPDILGKVSCTALLLYCFTATLLYCYTALYLKT